VRVFFRPEKSEYQHGFTNSAFNIYHFIYHYALTGNFQMVNLPQASTFTGPAAKAAPLFNSQESSRIDPRKRAALEASLETANNANHKFRSPCQLWN